MEVGHSLLGLGHGRLWVRIPPHAASGRRTVNPTGDFIGTSGSPNFCYPAQLEVFLGSYIFVHAASAELRASLSSLLF